MMMYRRYVAVIGYGEQPSPSTYLPLHACALPPFQAFCGSFMEQSISRENLCEFFAGSFQVIICIRKITACDWTLLQ